MKSVKKVIPERDAINLGSFIDELEEIGRQMEIIFEDACRNAMMEVRR